LAGILAHEGRYDEAEKLQRKARDIQQRVLGPDHPYTAMMTQALASVLALSGKRDQALSVMRDAVDHGLPPSNDLQIEDDPDMKSLHGDPRFDALVAHAKERAAAAAKKQ
jgi:predicted negative regulator of RcsB-dependent stress response